MWPEITGASATMELKKSVVVPRNNFELALMFPLERVLHLPHSVPCVPLRNPQKDRTSPRCPLPRPKTSQRRDLRTLRPDTLDCSSPSSRCSLWSAAWSSCTSITTTVNASRTCCDGAGINLIPRPIRRPLCTVIQITRWISTWAHPCHRHAQNDCPAQFLRYILVIRMFYLERRRASIERLKDGNSTNLIECVRFRRSHCLVALKYDFYRLQNIKILNDDLFLIIFFRLRPFSFHFSTFHCLSDHFVKSYTLD